MKEENASFFENGSFTNASGWIISGGYSNPFKQREFRIVFIVIYSAVFTLCILGNSLVLFAIARSPRLRTLTNFLLASLAVADLSVGVFCVLPNLSTFLQPNWILGKVMCKIYYYIWNVSYTSSITVLTVIAVERYVAILHPMRARHLMTNHRLIVIQAGIWLIAFLYNIPYIVFYDTFTFSAQNKQYCYASMDHMDNLKWLSLVNLIVWYFIPLILICYMYYKVIKVLWKTTVISAMRLQPYPDPDELSLSRQLLNGAHSNQDSGQGRGCVNGNRALTHEMTHETSGQSSSSSGLERYEEKVIFSFKGKHTITLVFGLRQRDETSPKEIKCFFSTSTNKPSSDSQGSDVTLRLSEPITESQRTLNYMNSFRTGRYKQTYLVSSRRVTRARRKVIRLLICVVVCFGICVLPHMLKVLNHFWLIYNLPHFVNALVSPVSFIILYMNSVLNPFLYAIFSKNFRRSFKETIPCLRKKRQTVAEVK